MKRSSAVPGFPIPHRHTQRSLTGRSISMHTSNRTGVPHGVGQPEPLVGSRGAPPVPSVEQAPELSPDHSFWANPALQMPFEPLRTGTLPTSHPRATPVNSLLSCSLTDFVHRTWEANQSCHHPTHGCMPFPGAPPLDSSTEPRAAPPPRRTHRPRGTFPAGGSANP